MDEDQCARKNVKKYLKFVDRDYYELESHIFFDDAWEDDPELGCRVPNAYVRQLISVVNDAASSVHKVPVELKPPVKYDLQYGGRLLWTLPGDSRLFVHLKDIEKIRNKKRWSQVMYMYYLLGHRIMELIQHTGRKQSLADNTFLLTIDGDSKFTPSAVQKLVDLMKKHRRVGAACGRIHPIGTGLVAWYQKFEYAIAHWFQKAAEHVFGCVLCAPGCFSIFRGSALMDDNVMNKYTKLPVQARHYVQYDQGEDRWLSTLLLKQGYRIEYGAAADAQTYAPEGFDEFFNQRRRWTPSSIANTLDLLSDYKKTVRNNDNISKLYVVYQMLVILFSLLGPAIIFTMMIFAQVAAFHSTSSTVLWANLIPVLIFCFLCFVSGGKTQLNLAKILGIVYAFVMMAVLVGTGIQIAAEGLGSPTSIFVISLVGIFTLAAFFHPREFSNIFYGAVFFLMIPCTYVLMSLYSLINLNVITWGTREAALRAAGKEVSGTVLQRWLRKIPFLRRDKNGDMAGRAESGKISCDCQRFCQCFLCPDDDRRIGKEDQRMIWIGERLEEIDQRLREGGRAEVGAMVSTQPIRSASSSPPVPEIHVTHPVEDKTEEVEVKQPSNVWKTATKAKQCDIFSVDSLDSLDQGACADLHDGVDECSRTPLWMNLDYLKSGPNDILDEIENQFWTDFIEEYLKPIEKSQEDEAELAVSLRRLRNHFAFAILVANGLLILIIYLLQNNKNVLSIEVTPYANYTWKKWNPATGTRDEVQEPLLVEPIGLTIILFLGLILGLQTLGMLLHRFHTISHVLATTVLTCFKRGNLRKVDGDQVLKEHAVDIVRNMQKLEEEEYGDVDIMSPPGRQKRKRGQLEKRKRRRNGIVYNLEQAKKGRQKVRGLSAAFQKRFFGFNPERRNKNIGEKGSALRSAASEALQRRREDVLRQPVERAPSRLHGHLSQPGKTVALGTMSQPRHGVANEIKSPSDQRTVNVFNRNAGKKTGRTSFLDEINSELKAANL